MYSGDDRTDHHQQPAEAFDRDAVLQPEELWANYGRDVHWATNLPLPTMQRLLGNCMAVQPVAAIVHAMICAYSGRIPSLWSPANDKQ